MQEPKRSIVVTKRDDAGESRIQSNDLCKNFLQGTCHYGDLCAFYHDPAVKKAREERDTRRFEREIWLLDEGYVDTADGSDVRKYIILNICAASDRDMSCITQISVRIRQSHIHDIPRYPEKGGVAILRSEAGWNWNHKDEEHDVIEIDPKGVMADHFDEYAPPDKRPWQDWVRNCVKQLLTPVQDFVKRERRVIR